MICSTGHIFSLFTCQCFCSPITVQGIVLKWKQLTNVYGHKAIYKRIMLVALMCLYSSCNIVNSNFSPQEGLCFGNLVSTEKRKHIIISGLIVFQFSITSPQASCPLIQYLVWFFSYLLLIKFIPRLLPIHISCQADWWKLDTENNEVTQEKRSETQAQHALQYMHMRTQNRTHITGPKICLREDTCQLQCTDYRFRISIFGEQVTDWRRHDEATCWQCQIRLGHSRFLPQNVWSGHTLMKTGRQCYSRVPQGPERNNSLLDRCQDMLMTQILTTWPKVWH